MNNAAPNAVCVTFCFLEVEFLYDTAEALIFLNTLFIVSLCLDVWPDYHGDWRLAFDESERCT